MKHAQKLVAISIQKAQTRHNEQHVCSIYNIYNWEKPFPKKNLGLKENCLALTIQGYFKE